MKKRISASVAYFNRCLDFGSEEAAEKESSSKLWNDLATWAFAQIPEIPIDLTPAAAEVLLDSAARKVKALRTATAWKSAARYFEAENFHALTGPACMRAKRLERKPTTRKATASRKTTTRKSRR